MSYSKTRFLFILFTFFTVISCDETTPVFNASKSKNFGTKSSGGGPSGPFVSVWRTTGAAESITLPLRAGFNYNFVADWGDGTTSTITSDADPDAVHVYAVANDYTVTITGLMETIYFMGAGDRFKIRSIPNLGVVGWTSFEDAFNGCANLTIVSGGDTSNVTNMAWMFVGATNVLPDMSTWDTSAVTLMTGMFSDINTNPDVSGLDTSSVTDMSFMFNLSSNANPDVSNWNVSNVIFMTNMFDNTPNAHPDVSNWNTSSVTHMDYIFAQSNANPDVSNWNTSGVTTMKGMFYFSPNANPDTSSWDTSSVNTMEAMFQSATSANPDTSGWNTTNVTNMNAMFAQTTANPDMSGWNLANVINMGDMFDGVDIGQVNYEALLIKLAAQNANLNVPLDGGLSHYGAGAGAAARVTLVGNGWVITDGGP